MGGSSSSVDHVHRRQSGMQGHISSKVPAKCRRGSQVAQFSLQASEVRPQRKWSQMPEQEWPNWRQQWQRWANLTPHIPRCRRCSRNPRPRCTCDVWTSALRPRKREEDWILSRRCCQSPGRRRPGSGEIPVGGAKSRRGRSTFGSSQSGVRGSAGGSSTHCAGEFRTSWQSCVHVCRNCDGRTPTAFRVAIQWASGRGQDQRVDQRLCPGGRRQSRQVDICYRTARQSKMRRDELCRACQRRWLPIGPVERERRLRGVRVGEASHPGPKVRESHRPAL